MRTIRAHAFENCESLQNIVVPSGVTSIGDLAFNGCPMELVVWVEKDSYADRYCYEEVLDVRYWDGSEPDKEERAEEMEAEEQAVTEEEAP